MIHSDRRNFRTRCLIIARLVIAIALSLAISLTGCSMTEVMTESPEPSFGQVEADSQNQTEQDDLDAALDAINFNIPLDPVDQEKLNRALALMKDQKWTEALSFLAALPPFHPTVLSNRLLAQARRDPLQFHAGGKANLDHRALAQLNRTELATASTHNLEGVLWMKLGHLQKAQSAFEQALLLSPKFYESLYNLGLIYDVYYQEPEKALPYYDQYLKSIPFEDEELTTWVESLRNQT